MTSQRTTDLVPYAARRLAARAAEELVLWTTRDGREIPLDEMSDEHMRNAVAALSRWRARIRRQPGHETTVSDIEDAISRFRRLLRRRAKGAAASATPRRLGRGKRDTGV